MLIRLVGTEKMPIFVVLKEVHIQKYPTTISDDWVLYYLQYSHYYIHSYNKVFFTT